MKRATLLGSLVLLVFTWSCPQICWADEGVNSNAENSILAPDYFLPATLIGWMSSGGILSSIPESIWNNLGSDPHEPGWKTDAYEEIRRRLNGGESGFNTTDGEFSQ